MVEVGNKIITSYYASLEENVFNTVWDWLKDENSGTIGIQGTNIHARGWADGSADSLKKMQMQILDQMKLVSPTDHKKKKKKMEKMKKKKKSEEDLRQEISSSLDGKRLLLMLDDIGWDSVDELESLGLPHPSKQNESFRLLHIGEKCSVELLGADRVLQLELLSFDEAFEWFVEFCRDVLGSPDAPIFDHPDVCGLAEDVVKDCNGSVLDILIISGTFRHLRGDNSPTSVAKHLEKIINLRHVCSFDSKKICYEMLPSKAMKDCCLYCTGFPFYYCIDVKELISSWIIEGCLDDVILSWTEKGLDGSAKAKDEGNCILEELIDRRFLYRLDENNVHVIVGLSDYHFYSKEKLPAIAGLRWDFHAQEVSDTSSESSVPSCGSSTPVTNQQEGTTAVVGKSLDSYKRKQFPGARLYMQDGYTIVGVGNKILASVHASLEENIFKKVSNWLKDENSGTIGIQGIHGIARHWTDSFVFQKVAKSNLFDIVIWVDGSAGSVEKMQMQMLDQLKLISTSDDKKKRKKMKKTTMTKKKNTKGEKDRKKEISGLLVGKRLLLIVDDVGWHSLDKLEALGVPHPSNQNKIFKIIHMGDKRNVEFVGADKVLYLDIFPFDEAFELFLKLSKDAFGSPDVPTFDSKDVRALAKAVVKDCNGSTLVLLALAGTFRNLRGDCCPTLVTKHLEKLIALRKICLTDYEMITYEMLPSKAMKDCLLYCTLYPFYYCINVKELISTWIIEGFLDDFLKANEEGTRILEELVDRNLLVRLDEDNVKLIAGKSYYQLYTKEKHSTVATLRWEFHAEVITDLSSGSSTPVLHQQVLHQQEGAQSFFDNRLLEEKFISSISVAMTSKLDDRKVLEWLDDADSGAIGVQGSNGNARTWIQRFLDSNVVDSNVFDIAIWVDGSLPWMGDMQLQIMDQIKLLSLKGGNEEEDEEEEDDDEEDDDDDEESDSDDDDDDVDPELINARMRILLSDLGQDLKKDFDVLDGREEMISASVAGKRVLLILEDMNWHGIDLLGSLGFPEHVSDDFVVLHTRDKQEAEFIDRVLYLDEYLFDEAFALFEKLSGVAFHSPGGPFDSPYLHALAEALLKDCNGAYLDISILAGTFRNLGDDYSPTLVAEHLKQLIELRKIHSMDSKKICYEMLPSNTMKDCFLYCTQYYRIYHRINVNRLISAWIREGFLCGFIYFENAFDNGKNILEELVNRFLLYRLNENNITVISGLSFTKKETAGLSYFQPYDRTKRPAKATARWNFIAQKAYVRNFGSEDKYVVESSSSVAAKKVLQWCNDANVGTIEIKGGLGSGRTWTAKHVVDNVARSALFEVVIWVNVEMEHCNRSKMLMQIADQLNLFSTIEKNNKKDKESEELLAQKISAILAEKRFLLVLDDMRLFFPYDLDGLGVPRPYIQNKSSKVLITGSEYLLNNEGANNVLSLVGGLPFHEAWYLFCEKAGMTFSSPELCPLAEMLVKDNSIGPLDTIILAGALRNRKGGSDLSPTLKKLEKAIGLKKKSYNFKKLCYEMLPNKNLKDCFLYCTYNTEYDSISVKGLITSWIIEGFIDGFFTLEEAYEQGHNIIQELEGRYLLSLSTDKNHVTMHDSLRDRQHYIFDKGSDLILANPEFFLDDRRIYLMDAKLRTKSPGSLEPTRPAILLLHGDGGRFLTEIKDAFIPKMQDIEVIAVLHSEIKSFPSFISNLPKLRVLVLRGCGSLENLNHIGGFRNLEVLSLSGTATFKEIPDNFFELMANLKTLNLSNKEIEHLPSSVSKLWRLEFLILSGCSNLKTLPRLEELTSLIVLDLSGCKSFRGINDECFGNKCDLHTLNLSRTQVAELPFLPRCINLRQLFLRDCVCLEKLPKLEKLTFLLRIDIFGCTALGKLEDKIFEKMCCLDTVDNGGRFIIGRSQVDNAFPQTCCVQEFNIHCRLMNVEELDIEGREQSFAPETSNEKICYMIKATELRTLYGKNPNCWKFAEQHGFGMVIQLLIAHKLKVEGMMDTRELSPRTTYGVYFVYKLSSDAKGFNKTPVQVLISFVKFPTCQKSRIVYLDPNNEIPPRTRKDRWLEIEMGEFFNAEGEDGLVYIILKETKSCESKIGITIRGIELRPKQSFTPEILLAKEGYMIKATELKYFDAENPKSWKYTTKARVGTVAELLDVPKLLVEGTMETQKLSPKTTYVAYFIYKLRAGAKGFDQTPVHVLISFIEIKGCQKSRSVYLDTNNAVWSRKRKDGWLEIEMGEFFNDAGEDGAINMILKDMNRGDSKSGLIIQGIELRPKHDSTPETLIAKKAYMIKATDLKYLDAENPKCWQYITDPRFGKVAQLLDVPKRRASGTKVTAAMETRELSPKTTYEAYFVYKLNREAEGFKQMPAKALISFIGMEDSERSTSVYLNPNSQVPPQIREDGWLEIKMGEFFNSEGEDGVVHMILKEIKRRDSKSGLVIQGIELRPKSV